MKVWPPIVNVPVRAVVVAFAATVYETDPFPLPLTPAPIVSQPSLLVELHAQPVAAVTVMLPEPPPAIALAEAGAIVGAHGAPACVTVNVLPPMVTVPVRALVVVLAAML